MHKSLILWAIVLDKGRENKYKYIRKYFGFGTAEYK